jgi:hypothetical protein
MKGNEFLFFSYRIEIIIELDVSKSELIFNKVMENIVIVPIVTFVMIATSMMK